MTEISLANTHESLLVTGFIHKDKQNRYATLLKNPKKRSKILDNLAHSFIRDAKADCCTLLDSGQFQLEHLSSLLGIKHPEAICYVISENTVLDGHSLSFSQAFQSIHQQGFGSIISCIPGEFAYYESEEGFAYILKNKPD